jgi:hypothetical protein
MKDVVSQMNTKSLLTRIGVPVLSLAMLGGLGATLATSASASTMATTLSASVKPATATVVASTHVAGVPDTTVGSVDTGVYEDINGNPTTDLSKSAFGPVWAIDDATDTYKVHSLGGNQYAVDRMVNGTFEAFAQPNAGPVAPKLDPEVNGQIHGTISYVVTSVGGPVASKLLPEQLPGTGSHAQLKQLFPDIQDSDISGGSDWVFAYHAAHGSMTQDYRTPSTTWGNITG